MLPADNLVSVLDQQAPGVSSYPLKTRCYCSDVKATVYHLKCTDPVGERKFWKHWHFWFHFDQVKKDKIAVSSWKSTGRQLVRYHHAEIRTTLSAGKSRGDSQDEIECFESGHLCSRLNSWLFVKVLLAPHKMECWKFGFACKSTFPRKSQLKSWNWSFKWARVAHTAN